MRSDERRGKERSQAEQLNWERDCEERECIWTNKRGTQEAKIINKSQCCNLYNSLSRRAITTVILTSDTCLLRPPLVLKVLLQ